MTEQEKKIQETAKQVAKVLSDNQITYSEVSRVFHETEYWLGVTLCRITQ